MSVKKKGKISIVRSFRLIDFQFYDKDSSEKSDDSSDEEKYKIKRNEKEFIIQMFGINEKGETCCIYINDFQPFFYVKVGDKWGQYEANELKNELSKKVLKFYSDSIVSCKIVDFYKLYGCLLYTSPSPRD